MKRNAKTWIALLCVCIAIGFAIAGLVAPVVLPWWHEARRITRIKEPKLKSSNEIIRLGLYAPDGTSILVVHDFPDGTYDVVIYRPDLMRVYKADMTKVTIP